MVPSDSGTASGPRWHQTLEGTWLPERSFPITRADLVRYAGASGDFNVIHWNERVATEVGLPGVIAHGMLALALAVRSVTDWAGDPAAVIECGARFARQVPVPDDDVGTALVVRGVVAKRCAAQRVRIDLTVLCRREKVLGRARALVHLR